MYHVHLPVGSVSEPLPMGRITDMMESGVITQDTQLCARGETEWLPLRYITELQQRAQRHALPSRAAAIVPSSPAPLLTSSSDPVPVGDALIRAAGILAVIGVALSILGMIVLGPVGAAMGGGGTLSLAMVLYIVGYCLNGR